jgi:hypothetical protein
MLYTKISTKKLKKGSTIRAELYQPFRHPAHGRPRIKFVCSLASIPERFLTSNTRRAAFWLAVELSLIANRISDDEKRAARNKIVKKVPLP